MRLKSVRILNFRCVLDSTEFKIDDHVTCLVGKNRSGKTALLEALTRLNATLPRFAEFSELDYPRSKSSEYLESGETADVVISTWSLDDADREALEQQVGPAAKEWSEITVRKGYANELEVDCPVAEEAVVTGLISEAGLFDDERRKLGSPATVAELASGVQEFDGPTERVTEFSKRLTRFGDGGLPAALRTAVTSRLPKFAYFPAYLTMDGTVSVDDLRAGEKNNKPKDGHRVFKALLAMVNRGVDDLEKMDQFEPLTADLEGASNRITRTIKKYWTQDRHLKINFGFGRAMPGDPPPFNDGFILRTRVENLRHGVTTEFDKESTGFRWFFSFLVWFSQVRRTYGDRLVILLDEPGLTLHARAQNDLLRFIEEELVGAGFQVLLTTHSPFMIDPENLLRARTVEDVFVEPDPSVPGDEGIDNGTKVGGEVLSTDRDTVFPLQAALGYEITQTLFVGRNAILVEGSSDLLYLKWFQRKLASLAGRVSLDRRWTITPCGGITKVSAFMALFGGSAVHVAVFTDIATGTKRTVRDVRRSKLLRPDHVFSADEFTGKEEADIEDLLGDELYVALVNAAYPQAKMAAVPDGTPVVRRVETHFRTLPPEMPEFDHFSPAEYLTMSGPPAGAAIDPALDRFEQVFRQLNALLT